MDGGEAVKGSIKIIGGAEDSYSTGYSASVRLGSATEMGNIETLQGLPVYLHRGLGRDLKMSLPPETREEHFLDEKLVKFYKKKGYSVASQ